MSEHSTRRGARTFQRLARAIARRWWIVGGVVVLVGIAASAMAMSAGTSPRYTESATVQIVAVPSGATSYNGYVARVRAESAAAAIAHGFLDSSTFADALARRVSTAAMTPAAAVQTALAAVHAGDAVTITVHWESKAGAESVLGAALAEIEAEVANGDLAASGDMSGDAQVRVVVTSAPAGAVVDQAAMRVGWRGVVLRLALALVVGVALAGAAWRWDGRRLRGATSTSNAEVAADGAGDA